METIDKTIYITEHDFRRLKGLVQSVADKRSNEIRTQHLRVLRNGLEQATVVGSQHMMPEVITMNSRFRMKDLESNIEGEYTLVFPGRADISRGRLSILAPVGAALLGAEALETISVLTPAGVKQFRIEAIEYQPEAAGEYFL